MFLHNKRLQYTVRVAEPNPGLANLLLEQFGGANGELAAAARYFTQALAEEDPGRARGHHAQLRHRRPLLEGQASGGVESVHSTHRSGRWFRTDRGGEAAEGGWF